LRRSVGNKAHGQLARDEFGRGRMMRQQVEHLLAFLFALLADALPEDELWSRLMSALVEVEGSALLRLFDAPPGQDLRQLGDVLLGVAAIDAERMQLHDFARVVFVQSAGAVLFGLRR